MENMITYSSKLKDDRSGWDIIKKNKETNEEEVVATFYDSGLKQAFLLFLQAK